METDVCDFSTIRRGELRRPFASTPLYAFWGENDVKK